MPLIKIVIAHPQGIEMAPEVSDDVQMRHLIPAMATEMQFPHTDTNGEHIVYQLLRDKTGTVLDDEDTLSGTGVQAYEHFTPVPMRLVLTTLTAHIQKGPVDSTSISAPIRIPKRENLTIGLIPADIVYRLEEYRSDQMRWESIMWVFVGAILGVIVNWATSDSIALSRTSLIVISIFIIITAILWFAVRDFKKRAEKMKERIEMEMYN